MFKCCECTDQINSADQFVIHLKEKHNVKNFTRLICAKENCDRIYDDFKTYRLHLRTHEKCKIPQSCVEQISHEQSDEVGLEDSLHDITFLRKSYVEESNVNQCLLRDTEKEFLKLILKYLCDPALPRKQVLQILTDAHTFYTSICMRVQSITKKQLALYSREDIVELDQIFSFIINRKVPSEYKILVDVKKAGLLVNMKTNLLTTEGVIEYNDNTPFVKEIKYESKLVDIREYFKILLNLPNYLSNIHDYMLHLSKSTKIVNIIQCPLWKKKN